MPLKSPAGRTYINDGKQVHGFLKILKDPTILMPITLNSLLGVYECLQWLVVLQIPHIGMHLWD